MTTLIKYPFDPTGVRPTNLILDEQHDKLDPFTRLLIPKLGMYYTESLIVKDSTRIYALNTDYVPVEFDQETSLRVGKELCRAIIIKSTNYSLPITITYQVVGDDTTNNRNEVLIRFQELVDYTSNQSFNNLIEVPSALRSSPHPHGFNEIYGMEYIVNELDRITKAINDTPVPTINSILQHIDRYIELFNNLSQSNLDHFFISRIDEFLLTINRQFLQIENISNYTPGTLEDGLKVGDITTIKETVGTFEFPEKYATIETLIGLRQKIYKNCVTMRSCNIGYESAVYSEPRKNSLYVLNNQQTVTKVSQQTAIEENFPFDTGIYPDPVPIENEITITKISNDVTTNLGLLSSVDSTQEKMYLGRLSFNSSAFDTEWKTFDCTDKIHKLINVVVAHNNDFCEPYGDPHELVKSDIELDKVENLEVVTREDIIALTSTRKYLTFDSLIYFMRSFLLQNGKKSPIDDKSNNKFLIDNCQLVFSPAGVKCEVVCEERPLDFLKTDQLCILVETPPTTPTPSTTITPSTTVTPTPTTSISTTTTTTTTPSTTPTPTSLVSPHIPVMYVNEETNFRKNTNVQVMLSGSVDSLMPGYNYTNEYFISSDLNANWVQLGTTDIIVKDQTQSTTPTSKTVTVNPGQANILYFKNVVRLVDYFSIYGEYTTNTTNPKTVYPELTTSTTSTTTTTTTTPSTTPTPTPMPTGWWSVVSDLTPVAIHDAKNITDTKILDRVGTNHITSSTSLTTTNRNGYIGIIGDGITMEFTSAITGIDSGSWIFIAFVSGADDFYIFSDSALNVGGTGDRIFHISTNGYIYVYVGTLGFEYLQVPHVTTGEYNFIALEIRSNGYMRMYSNGVIYNEPGNTTYRPSKISRFGSTDENGMKPTQSMAALGIWNSSRNLTLSDFQALESACRSALANP